MMWRILVLCAVLVVLVSFLFVFTPGVQGPSLFSIPYLLWTGILATALLVVLTYLGAKFFTLKEK